MYKVIGKGRAEKKIMTFSELKSNQVSVIFIHPTFLVYTTCGAVGNKNKANRLCSQIYVIWLEI